MRLWSFVLHHGLVFISAISIVLCAISELASSYRNWLGSSCKSWHSVLPSQLRTVDIYQWGIHLHVTGLDSLTVHYPLARIHTLLTSRWHEHSQPSKIYGQSNCHMNSLAWELGCICQARVNLFQRKIMLHI